MAFTLNVFSLEYVKYDKIWQDLVFTYSGPCGRLVLYFKIDKKTRFVIWAHHYKELNQQNPIHIKRIK